MNSLRLSSLLLFAFYSCAPYRSIPESDSYPKCFDLLVPAEETLLYNTQIDFYKKHFSGLLLLKTIEAKRRAVFTSEMGVTFFDFEFSPNGDFKIIKITSGLQRKFIVNSLRQNIALLAAYPPQDSCCVLLDLEPFWVMKEKKSKKEYNCYYVAMDDSNRIVKAQRYHRGRKIAEAEFFDTGESSADSIALHHKRLKLSMYFKKLKR